MKQDKGIEDSRGRAMVDRMVQPLSRWLLSTDLNKRWRSMTFWDRGRRECALRVKGLGHLCCMTGLVWRRAGRCGLQGHGLLCLAVHGMGFRFILSVMESHWWFKKKKTKSLFLCGNKHSGVPVVESMVYQLPSFCNYPHLKVFFHISSFFLSGV